MRGGLGLQHVDRATTAAARVVDSARPNESLDLQVAAVALNHTEMLVSFEGDFLISGCP